MNLFGGRRRNLLLGVVAVGLLLVAFAVFLLTPGSGKVPPVPVSFQKYETNAPDDVVARFSVTNAGKKTIIWMIVESETQLKGQWTSYHQNFNPAPFLKPGGFTNVSVRVPHDNLAWRMKVEWMDELTGLRKGRLWFSMKMGDFDGVMRARNAHTHHSDVFPR
jgi:hypothetical protein